MTHVDIIDKILRYMVLVFPFWKVCYAVATETNDLWQVQSSTERRAECSQQKIPSLDEGLSLTRRE